MFFRKGKFRMGELSLLDLAAILIEKEGFNIERNGEKMFDVDSDELWEEIHKEKFIKAEFFGEDVIHIKLQSNELILLL
jgi:hypothetical protein